MSRKLRSFKIFESELSQKCSFSGSTLTNHVSEAMNMTATVEAPFDSLYLGDS
jgi:hypothetical protein